MSDFGWAIEHTEESVFKGFLFFIPTNKSLRGKVVEVTSMDDKHCTLDVTTEYNIKFSYDVSIEFANQCIKDGTWVPYDKPTN
jgi:hypothetical protein